MVKIRLMGKPEEVYDAKKLLDQYFRVLQTSPPYQNRNSEYIRVYLDVLPKSENEN